MNEVTMSAHDPNPNVRVPDEPEDEIPIGTGEAEEPESDGLATDPYADDMPFRLARARVPRLLVLGVIILILVALLVLLIAIRAR
jgi:hypothetical protein